ncbi:AcrB/AcrD/AcrF family protein [Chryseotalea sanaruensis]|uniref:AcrB/AcrD/AcrF family protein n=1 Tax=Chryseotalea sanaruensis TaxID=2482724 RepID=A0A401UEP2_9BACT|nr:efflux RND transporter permease subunit [Chryseotalea sanaruensis]GCC53385.1 AcrB/AcrD/AcrF family protein [Chryseotalea sanaruensis]
MSDSNNIDKENKKVDKEFGLTTFSLKNNTMVMFLTALITIVGISTYVSMPKDSYPEIKQPIVYIGTPYPGNSPIDMENLVTRQIEKELNTISEIDNIKSTSVQDYSTIIVEFDPKISTEQALSKVKDAVDRAKPELPQDLPADPNVFELNFSEFPIMNINLAGNYTLEELKRYGEYLEDEIEKVSEVSKVEIRGIDDKEVKIKVNPYELEARKLNFGDIEQAVTAENVTLSGGNVLDGGVRRTIRVVGEFTNPKQLENIVIKNEDGNIVYLKDVATVEFDYVEAVSYARLRKEPVVMLDVVKRSGENLLIATEKINAILEKTKTEVFPKDLKVSITNDQSSFTKEMVSSLENNIISGVIVVVIVLLLFIGTRNAMFVGMAIPISMFLTFIILNAMGITINMMVLFGLIMALGMLVDNGIVVVENVYRLRSEGYTMWDATRLGVGEVALPIISSTATTVAAFIPLMLWPGIMGQFMSYLPITLAVSLAASLFVALVINPVFILNYMKLDEEIVVNHKAIWRNSIIAAALGIVFLLLSVTWLGNLLILFALLTILNVYVLVPLSNRFQQNLLPRLEKRYEILIEYALHGRKPYFIFFGTVGLLFLSIILLGIRAPKVLFFPENEPKYVNVFIEFPLGADIQETDAFTKVIEDKVITSMEVFGTAVESIIANVGAGTGDPNDMSSIGQAESPNKARITVNFVDFKYRQGVNTNDALDKLRKDLGTYPGVSVTAEKNADGPPTGKPVMIELTGDNLEVLIVQAEKMKAYINEAGIPGVEKLKIDLETGKPEMLVNIDREKARRFGLSTFSVASEVRTSLFGKEISKFKQGEDDYKIQLRLDDKYRYDVDALMNKNITYRNQTNGRIVQVPISAVAKAELSSTYGSVKRKDLKRQISISSNVLGGFNPTEVNQKIKDHLEDFQLPAGYSYKFGGEQEKQAEEMSFLSGALMIAVFLIFLIIVAQFNKLTAPLIIMTSVLFSTIGVFLGLVIFNMEFVIIMTMVGIISLAGIVVNNAIVLLDFVELKKKRKREETGKDLTIEEVMHAIAEAGKTRLRPVLLTAITTVLGLIPLAVGINIDFIKFFNVYDADFYIGGDSVAFWAPLSWTIIFGLIFATFLTLVVVPVMYLLVEKFMFWLNRKTGIKLQMSNK